MIGSYAICVLTRYGVSQRSMVDICRLKAASDGSARVEWGMEFKRRTVVDKGEWSIACSE